MPGLVGARYEPLYTPHISDFETSYGQASSAMFGSQIRKLGFIPSIKFGERFKAETGISPYESALEFLVNPGMAYREAMQDIEDSAAQAEYIGQGEIELMYATAVSMTPLQFERSGLKIRDYKSQRTRRKVVEIDIKRWMYEKRVQSVIERRPEGPLGHLAVFGGAMLAEIADPFALAANFIPIFGEAKMLAMTRRFGSFASRSIVATGEGVAGSILSEGLQAKSEHDIGFSDYTLEDAFFNIAVGTALSLGVYHVGGTTSDFFAGRPGSKRFTLAERATKDLKDREYNIRKRQEGLRNPDFSSIPDPMRRASKNFIEHTLNKNPELLAPDYNKRQPLNSGVKEVEGWPKFIKNRKDSLTHGINVLRNAAGDWFENAHLPDLQYQFDILALDELKARGLITPEEYRAEFQAIMSERAGKTLDLSKSWLEKDFKTQVELDSMATKNRSSKDIVDENLPLNTRAGDSINTSNADLLRKTGKEFGGPSAEDIDKIDKNAEAASSDEMKNLSDDVSKCVSATEADATHGGKQKLALGESARQRGPAVEGTDLIEGSLADTDRRGRSAEDLANERDYEAYEDTQTAKMASRLGDWFGEQADAADALPLTKEEKANRTHAFKQRMKQIRADAPKSPLPPGFGETRPTAGKDDQNPADLVRDVELRNVFKPSAKDQKRLQELKDRKIAEGFSEREANRLVDAIETAHLTDLTDKELRAVAKHRGVTLQRGMRKADVQKKLAEDFSGNTPMEVEGPAVSDFFINTDKMPEQAGSVLRANAVEHEGVFNEQVSGHIVSHDIENSQQRLGVTDTESLELLAGESKDFGAEEDLDLVDELDSGRGKSLDLQETQTFYAKIDEDGNMVEAPEAPLSERQSTEIPSTSNEIRNNAKKKRAYWRFNKNTSAYEESLAFSRRAYFTSIKPIFDNFLNSTETKPFMSGRVKSREIEIYGDQVEASITKLKSEIKSLNRRIKSDTAQKKVPFTDASDYSLDNTPSWLSDEIAFRMELPQILREKNNIARENLRSDVRAVSAALDLEIPTQILAGDGDNPFGLTKETNFIPPQLRADLGNKPKPQSPHEGPDPSPAKEAASSMAGAEALSKKDTNTIGDNIDPALEAQLRENTVRSESQSVPLKRPKPQQRGTASSFAQYNKKGESLEELSKKLKESSPGAQASIDSTIHAKNAPIFQAIKDASLSPTTEADKAAVRKSTNKAKAKIRRKSKKGKSSSIAAGGWKIKTQNFRKGK